MPKHRTDEERLHCLQDYYASEKAMPSYSRLASILGYSCSSAAAAAAKRLAQVGYLRRGDGGRLAPGPRFFERDIGLSRVPAGSPAELDDFGSTTISIDAQLVRTPSRTFVVRLKGDSMIDAGLLDGDFVVAERDAVCRNGSIVVANVDGQVTVKYLFHAGTDIFLRAANKAYKDIKPKEQLYVVGLVVGSFRKLI